MDYEHADFNGLPLDRTTIAQALLNIDNKTRSNFFPWNGQFSPQLIEVLLRTYAPKKGLVLDPFAGSGTVLCEAATLGIPVVGAEINPAACKMAQVYRLMNLSVADRKTQANRLERALQEHLPNEGSPLFGNSGQVGKGPKEILIEIHRELPVESARTLLEPLIVLVDFYKEVTTERVFDKWAMLKRRILSLPQSATPIRLLNCDARRLCLRDDDVDFVVTSPPYINVFNYHQQYRKSAEALGWDLLAVARSEIGSNRKHRQNRLLTVIQYCLDMTEVLRELQRTCKEGSRIVMIVGRESNVRKTRFFNGEIMVALAARCAGFAVLSRQERLFINRFGEPIYEDILHFEVRKGAAVEEPRAIGREVLLKAMKRAPEESLADLDEAVNIVEEVQGSPLYDLEAATERPCRAVRALTT